jgi:hypothetical protein
LKNTQKLFAILVCLFLIGTLVRSEDVEEDKVKLSVKSQYDLVDFVSNLPRLKSTQWQRVEVLMDFESVPKKILSYIYLPDTEPTQISLAEAPADIWDNFFRGYSMSDALKPTQIQMTICRDRTERFPIAIHYISTTFGDRKLSAELSDEDHMAIAGALENDC